MGQEIHNEESIEKQVIIEQMYGNIFNGEGKVIVHINEISKKLAHSILFYRIEKTEGDTYQGQLKLRSDTLKTEQLLDPIPIEIPHPLRRDLAKFTHNRLQVTGRNTILAERANPTALFQEEIRLGEELYKALFPAPIEERLLQFQGLLQERKIQSLSLIISSEEEGVLNLPFALMRKAGDSHSLAMCNDNFLLAHSKERSLKTFDVGGIEQLEAPLRILFVTALPEDMSEQAKFIQLERETVAFIRALDPLRQQGSVAFEILDIASLDNIQEALSKGKHHILHISGHGIHAERQEDSAGYLYLENENGEQVKVSGEELAKALTPYSSLKLIMLSACETARAEAKGVVGALIDAKLPAVIGMRYPVTDLGARLFTQCFYENLCQGDQSL